MLSNTVSINIEAGNWNGYSNNTQGSYYIAHQEEAHGIRKKKKKVLKPVLLIQGVLVKCCYKTSHLKT